MCSGTVPSLSLISKWLTSEEFYTIINWLSLFMIVSSLALVLLHLYLYGWNLYTWRQTRINYPFIFEFKPGTELGYRQVLCVASGFTSLLLAAMNSHLYISTKRAPRFKVSEIIPLAAVLIFVTAIFAPVNLLYRSARRFFIRCFQHLILAPFRRVQNSLIPSYC